MLLNWSWHCDMGKTLFVKHSAHILNSINWAESRGVLTTAGPGSASLETKPLKGRKTRTGEVCTQGPKWGRERSSVVLYVSPWSSSITGNKIVQRGVLKHTEKLAGTSSGIQVLHRGDVWVGHGWLKQPGLSLCKASCASTTSKVCDPSCHLKNLHYTEVMFSCVCQGHHCSFS